ncbi:MAG: zinc-dependent metalloprotease [Prevotellaceae bacterium]|nr:zinc-dependent metalloprotease [Prevotellaceae bacterium]
MTHEFGHCLGLYHTHSGSGCFDDANCSESINGSNCLTCGDLVCDTPADPCLAGNVNSSCNYIGGGGYNPNTNNIMSYAPPACLTNLTNGQIARMHTMIENSSILQNVLYFPISGNNNPYSIQQVTYTVTGLITGTTVTSWNISSNANIINGQGTNQITISICSGYTVTLTATISGTVNKIITKTLTVNSGNLTVVPSIGKMQVTLYHPYAQCFDWVIDGDIVGRTTTNIVGSGNINCSSYSSLIFKGNSKDPTFDDDGYVQVRAKNNSCYTPWHNIDFATWRPVFNIGNSNLNPSTGQSFYASLVEGYPFTNQNWDGKYYWYRNSAYLGYTSVPYISSSNWTCGQNLLTVYLVDGVDEVYESASIYGSCSSSYSAAYPNPASDELIIDKIEETNTESTTNNILQTTSTKTKQSEITVLLYSNSTTKLVYSKNYPSSEKQIKIDTSKLPNGVYYLNIIENGETVKQQTIIVNH